MKRRFTALLVLVVMLANCFFTTSFADDCEHQWTLEYDPVYIYDCVDETYHALRTIELDYICLACKETKVEYQDGNAVKGQHVFSGNICYTCGYERKEEKHEHDWKLAYDPLYEYVEYNEKYHVLDRIILDYSCECGETKHEEQSGNGEREKHNFSGNTCYTCGYERKEEKHEHDWKLAYAPWYEYVEYNEDYHILDKIILDYSCECGETKHEEQSGNGEKEKHNFDGNTCYTCGYGRKEEKHEHDWKLAYAPWYEYVEYNEDYHILDKIILDYSCECGETKREEQSGNGETEKHNFNGNTCSICGYIKRIEFDNQEEEKPEETKKPEITADNQKNGENKPNESETTHVCKFNEPYQVWIGAYTNVNNQTHTQQRVTFAYCIECGEKRIFSNESEVVEHTFENGICKWCKYEYKIPVSSDDARYAQEQISELKLFLNTLEGLKKRSDFSISEDAFNSIKNKINNFIYEYNAVLNGKKTINEVSKWRNDSDIKLIQSVQDGSYKKIAPPKLVNINDDDIVYINLAKPDNKWYYLVADTGEQVILGNFSKKVTIVGVAAQIFVGEIPVIGTIADVRDVTVDFVNWKWSWGHVGVTALDVIGLIPIIGALKYTDEIGAVARGVKLSDGAGEILTDVLKHADDASDVVSKSDEVGDIVQKAIIKHADEIGDAAKAVSRNYDDVVRAVKHPEIFNEGALEHVFKGTNGRGFHYEGLSDATGKIIEITKFPDANGVYEATVEIGGKLKKQPSTFFPKDWSPEQILDAVEEAYGKRVLDSGNVYKGVTSSGITIEMYIDMNNNKINSFFPVMSD